MANLIVQTIFESATGLPADSIVNTTSWTGSLSDLDNIRDILVDFYAVQAPDAQNTILYWMSNEAISGNVTIKIYDRDDPKPRQPIEIFESDLSEGLGPEDMLPTECAIVVSYQASRIAGLPQNRRRNRFYMGGFGVEANDNGRINPGLVETILFASKEMLNAASASVDKSLIVWSGYYETGYTIDNGWVDNAWDSQRRRGLKSTARGAFSLSEPTA